MTAPAHLEAQIRAPMRKPMFVVFDLAGTLALTKHRALPHRAEEGLARVLRDLRPRRALPPDHHCAVAESSQRVRPIWRIAGGLQDGT